MESIYKSPLTDGFFLPAEWEPHERTWIEWPARADIWGEALPQAHAAYAGLVRAVAEFEPVSLIVRPEDEATARFACGRDSAVELHVMAQDDGRIRDNGPMFVIDGMGGVAGIDWQYDGLGGRFRHIDNDRRLAGKLLDEIGLKRYEGELVLEGGAVCADGSGTLIATEAVLLDSNRNREHSHREIEEALAMFCGARRIIWLGGGMAHDEAGGHVDQVAAFTGPARVAVACGSEADPVQAEVLADARAQLSEAKDARGRALEIVDVPLTRDLFAGTEGHGTQFSYVGFYPVNGGLLVPAYGDAHDARARDILAELFPTRKAVSVPAGDLAWAGRSLHAAVLAQPAALADG